LWFRFVLKVKKNFFNVNRSVDTLDTCQFLSALYTVIVSYDTVSRTLNVTMKLRWT